MTDKLEEEAAAGSGLTRRSLLGNAVAATLLAGVPAVARASGRVSGSSTFMDLLRNPDWVTAYAELATPMRLDREGSEWRGGGVEVETKVAGKELAMSVGAPGVALRYLHVRWKAPVGVAAESSFLVMGDHWERSYGDLVWRNVIPERVMPWYFSTYDGRAFHSYGVKTGAGALCFWQLDTDGVSLWLNVSNGGSGVQLGQRRLAAATIVSRKGAAGENGTAAIHAFCKQMCARPSRAFAPVYGTNDWYYAYGNNSAKQILDDTEFISGLADSNAVRPFSVIDDGWQRGSNSAYGDMGLLARQIRERRARPGIWIRPTLADEGTDRRLLLPDARFGARKDRAGEMALDVTMPEAAALGLAKVKQVAEWGYELIKHDFSTYDLLGQWGFEMGADPTLGGWALHDRTRTNAEVIEEWYSQIRMTAGEDKLILGCNTVGHLGQGLFDIARTGDDTSGKVWERTRRMGVNTLAFRLPQHEAFFVQDADCVGISAAVPWKENRQWLDLLAQSGTAVFVSPGEGARTADHAAAIRDAFALAAAGGSGARPETWRQESTPQDWVTATGTRLRYDWCSPEGALPFAV